ncbi:MAG: alpha/beta hydrolase [Lentisphaeraceae bacterium]|nr:alpha/beta hydrolase [Lentisphaeraceae bacterium]
MKILQLLIITSLVLLTSCNVLVYHPEKTSYDHPRDYDINYENIFIRTSDNVALHAWWLSPIEQDAKGTIIHFHSSEKNISYHLNDSRRFVEQGYNVLLFDYRGFGHSDGIPNKWGLTKDGLAAINYIVNRDDVDNSKIVIFAQAEGAPIALSALNQYDIKPTCIIFDNPLFTYRKIAEETVEKIPIGKALGLPSYLAASLHDYQPDKDLKATWGVPLLICHSENNDTISSEHSLSIYKNATEPKTLYLTKGAGHLNLLQNKKHFSKITSFISENTENTMKPVEQLSSAVQK